ncbi:MAG TPA: hypothetical protein PKB03_08900, partial [Baekduia sp.]|nr:hypothetical protein [Baekduia sp.]
MTSSASQGPLRLLLDAEEAEEALFLTYTANLEFFERFALGQARSLQAATTVIADATMVTSDPLSVRGAGLRYLDERAVCPSRTAFHPKLIVLASRDQAMVAVGSGNLTLAGWHGNHELWTVLRGDRDGGPSTLRGISRFLRQLGQGPVPLTGDATGALERVAGLLDGLPAGDVGPGVASTLDGRIIDAFPLGPVDELMVYAPFHDSGLAGMTAVVERLQPRQLTVFVQPQTSVDGDKLVAWLTLHSGRLAWCSDGRYRHGKLIEWTQAGQRFAVTGSPNLSRPALLRGIEEGGNCELALIGTVDHTSWPEEVPPPAEGVQTLTFKTDPADADPGAPPTVLLSAVLLASSEIELRLAADLTYPARVQAHDPSLDWDTFLDKELAPGASVYRVPALGFAPGRAVRLLGTGGASSEVFVRDPIRARARPIKRIGRADGTPAELLLAGQLGVLYEDAELLRSALLKAEALVPVPGAQIGPGGDRLARPASGQTLADYLHACSAVVPEAIVEWALVLPTLGAIGGDDLDRRTGILTTETDDEAADAGDAGDRPPPSELAQAIR